MIASAHRKQIEQSRRYGPFQRFGWGYGWDLGTYGDETIVSRFGAFSGYRSHRSFMPERGTGVVVLVNGGGPASTAADVMATYIYDSLSDSPKLDAASKLRISDLRALADATRYNLAKDLAERRARMAPLPRPLPGLRWRLRQPQARTYGVARSRQGTRVAHGSGIQFGGSVRRPAESVARDLHRRWRGRGVRVPARGGSAQSLQYRAETFERV